jgi:hypothetical protein
MQTPDPLIDMSTVIIINFPPASASFWLGLLFDPEDGGDVLLKRRDMSELHSFKSEKTVPVRLDYLLMKSVMVQLPMLTKGFSAKSKSKSHYDRRSVGQFILMSFPFLEKVTRRYIYLSDNYFIFHVGRPL